MKKVEMIYDRDCPNIAATRAQLLRAFAQVNQSPRWTEWEQSDPASPPYVRAYGSPTVLVDGKDVAGAEPSGDVACCRLYTDVASGGGGGEMHGVPSVTTIASAFAGDDRGVTSDADAGRQSGWRKSGWLSSLATLPGIGAAFLPAGLCPVCWPAYAGMLGIPGALGTLGLGFLLKTTWLLPITAICLLVAVGALAFRAGSRRGYGPFILGLVASAILMIGKFIFLSNPAMYGGIALLVAASFWNAWPRKTTDTCSACAPGGQASTHSLGAKEVSL